MTNNLRDFYATVNGRPDVMHLYPHDRVAVLLPHSEVCMSMRVAGQWMMVEILPGMYGYSAQILGVKEDGEYRPYSAPILLGEAGIIPRPRPTLHSTDWPNQLD